MTKEQVKEKIGYLILNSDGYMNKLIDKAIESGAIDITNAEENYLVPKIILTAVYREMAYQYEPLTKAGKKEVDNLKVFL